MMLEQVLLYLKNWFVVPDGKHIGEFTVEDGGIVLPFIRDGQYFRVIGSIFNDGLYQYPASGMIDEVFDGAVWALALPPLLLKIVAEMEAWQEKYGENVASPYSSESFGGYSYSKGVNGDSSGAAAVLSQFSGRIAQWRKL